MDFDALCVLTFVGVTAVPGSMTVVTDTIVVNVCPFDVNLRKPKFSNP